MEGGDANLDHPYIFMNKWMKALDMDPVRFLLLIFFILNILQTFGENRMVTF